MSVLNSKAPGLGPLLDMISFEELKRVRLVCREFDTIIRESPRFIKSKVKIDPRWKTTMKQLAHKQIPKWENVFFDGFPLTRNKFLREYWNHMRLKLKILTLYKIHCKCTVMAHFINGCLLLEEVTVDDVRFKEKKEHVGDNGQQREIKTTCRHEVFHGTNEQPIAPTIKCLEIANQNIIPICVLDLFQQKCRGHLTEFKISGQNILEAERELCIPTQEQVRRKIQDILRENVLTLKSFSLIDCRGTDGGLFVTDLPNSIQTLQLEQISFGIPRQNPRDVILYLNCIQNMKINLQLRGADGNQYRNITELNLSFHGSFSNCQNLRLIVNELKQDLKVLRIEFLGKILEQDFDLGSSLEAANLLHTLVVRKAKNTLNEGMNFNPEFLNKLPPNLKQLTVDLNPAPTSAIFSKIIEPAKCGRITQLIIGNGGKEFKNEHMHITIKNMPLLTDLQVISASKLSDNGICSIPSKLAENIVTNKSYFLLDNPELLFQNQTEEEIVLLSELKYLRNISFRGCNITDVSVRLAFHFPEVRSVDLSSNLNVTDVGLVWLCQQNPTIENLTVKDMIKVSYFGIMHLIKSFPTLAKIYTTHAVSDRVFSELKSFEWPRVNQAVHVSRI